MNTLTETEDNDVTEEIENEELKAQEGAPKSDEGSDEQSDGDEAVEIVLEGEDGSQPDRSNLGIRKRINKLNAKVNEAKDGAQEAQAALEAERQKNKLLELALEQQKEAKPSGPPDPLDYDGGAGDAKYVEALNTYTSELVRAEMAKHVAQPVQQADNELEVKQTQHYEKAERLKIGDYDEVEDVAIGILGKDTVNHLIKNSGNSPVILYHLGKNPAKAEQIADLVKRNPIKGVMELGALEARLKVTKVKRNQAPDPDDELEGTTSPRTTQRGPKGAKFE